MSQKDAMREDIFSQMRAFSELCVNCYEKQNTRIRKIIQPNGGRTYRMNWLYSLWQTYTPFLAPFGIGIQFNNEA